MGAMSFVKVISPVTSPFCAFAAAGKITTQRDATHITILAVIHAPFHPTKHKTRGGTPVSILAETTPKRANGEGVGRGGRGKRGRRVRQGRQVRRVGRVRRVRRVRQVRRVRDYADASC